MDANRSHDPATGLYVRRTLIVMAGYVAACLATVLVFFALRAAFGGGIPQSQILPMLLTAFAYVSVLALPGFAVMRLALYLTRRKDCLSFAIAGGLTGVTAIAATSIYDWIVGAEPSVGSPWDWLLWLVGLGVVAGVACWAAERWVSRLLPPHGEPML